MDVIITGQSAVTIQSDVTNSREDVCDSGGNDESHHPSITMPSDSNDGCLPPHGQSVLPPPFPPSLPSLPLFLPLSLSSSLSPSLPPFPSPPPPSLPSPSLPPSL